MTANGMAAAAEEAVSKVYLDLVISEQPIHIQLQDCNGTMVNYLPLLIQFRALFHLPVSPILRYLLLVCHFLLLCSFSPPILFCTLFLDGVVDANAATAAATATFTFVLIIASSFSLFATFKLHICWSSHEYALLFFCTVHLYMMQHRRITDFHAVIMWTSFVLFASFLSFISITHNNKK